MKRFLFCLVALLVVSCGKVNETIIPYARVYLQLNLTYADKDLVGALKYKTFNAIRYSGEAVGYAGVLVVCGYNTSGGTQYYAYSLCCPYEAKRNVLIVPDNTGYAKCPECGTTYEIAYGTGQPSNGPSKYALLRYNVTQSTEKLVVSY